MTVKYPFVLFDLDGTLSESGPGIKKCIELTLEKMGYPEADLSDYSRFVGPPLVSTFNGLCGINDMEKSYRAVEIYTEFYDASGIRFNRLYDGLSDVLTTLKANGVRMAVCSSKAQRLADEVVELLGIREYFDTVIGSLPGGVRKKKKEAICCALDYFGVCDENRKSVIHTGDAVFDLEGAREAGVDFLGVCYGYGKKEEFISLGADKLADAPGDILKYILEE